MKDIVVDEPAGVELGNKYFGILRPMKESPNKKQVRNRSRWSENPVMIPEILSDDGLTLETLNSIIDEYLAHRIEPEEIMYTNLNGGAWGDWENSLFTMHCLGVRCINEIDYDDAGQFTSVYVFFASDEEEERQTTLSCFFDKWTVSIKEKCHIENEYLFRPSQSDNSDYGDDRPNFWFVIEFSTGEASKNTSCDSESHDDEYKKFLFLTHNYCTISFVEGEWSIRDFRDEIQTLTDFRLHHRGI